MFRLARGLLSYRREWLAKDVVAGIVLSTLLVPQGMAYAELAGLPPITGLYTSILCLLGYAVFGPSKILVLGPDSSLGPMIAATILPLAGADGDPARAIALASMLALITGGILVLGAVAKLGFIADLISKPTMIGYMNGLALTILVGQLPKLFGFKVGDEPELGHGPEDQEAAGYEREHRRERDGARGVAVGAGQRQDRRGDHRAERGVRPQHQDLGRAEHRVAEQAQDGGVQARDRRQPGQLGVGHALRHQQGAEHDPGHDIPGQPFTPVRQKTPCQSEHQHHISPGVLIELINDSRVCLPAGRTSSPPMGEPAWSCPGR